MPNNWPIITLGEACEVLTDGAHASPKDYPGGLPMASVKDMTRWGINIKTCRTISPEDFEAQVRNGCQPLHGDVLIAKDGATCLDTVCEYKQADKIVLLSSVAILRPSKLIRSGYLRYYLDCAATRSMLKDGYVSGSAIPRVVLKDFRRAPIPIPPIEVQDNIAGILGALDDKIELNRKMNETLEQMAKVLFRSWFVDFDPVHAKAAGRQPAGMDRATADLFPDSFVDSELGKLPKGWEISTLGEDVTITRGCSYKSEDLASSSTAMVTLKSFKRGGGYRHDGLKSYTGAYKPAQVVHAGELVVSYTDVTQAAELIGRPAIVSTTPDFKQLVISQDVSVVRPKNSTPISYLYGLMMEESFRAHTYAHSTGTTVLHLSSTALPSFKFIKPKTELLAAFDKTAANLLRLADENHQQSRLLSATRDALLPKLLSGALVP
jgi:type I restriction enzyme S subunit